MARKFRNIRGVRTSVRETSWVFGTWTQATMGSANTAVLMSSFGAAVLELRPFTIVRTRGLIHVKSDQVVGSEQYTGAFGLSVVSDQAIAIGITAVPTPQTDGDSDLFFVYEPWIGEYEFRTAIGASTAAGQQRMFDSKAMRKIEFGMDVAVTVETSTLSNGCLFAAEFRQLIKLH